MFNRFFFFFDAYTLWQLTHSGRGSSPCCVLRVLLATWVAGRLPRQWEGEGAGREGTTCPCRRHFNEIPDQCLFSWGHHGNAKENKVCPPLPSTPLSSPHSPFEGRNCSCCNWRVPQTQTRVPHHFLRNESINEAFRGQLRVVKEAKTLSVSPSHSIYPSLLALQVQFTARFIFDSIQRPHQTPNNSKSLFQFEIFLWFIKKEKIIFYSLSLAQ